MQENCIEQNMPRYIVFIDFAKAFDTVSKRNLWAVLQKYGCPTKFLNIIGSLHSGMQAYVVWGNTNSKEFDVSHGVKQGCVLAPTLLSLYPSAMLKVAFADAQDGVYPQTRHNTNLFSVDHF